MLKPDAPLARRQPSIRELHGDTVADDYAWMRDPDDPALREYLAAERAYYDAQTHHLRELATTLAAEALSRFPARDEFSFSWPSRGYSYRTRLPEHADNVQLLRSREGETAEDAPLAE